MADPGDPRKQMTKQASISSFEQGLNIITAPPVVEPITIYPGPSAKHANMPKVKNQYLFILKDNQISSINFKFMNSFGLNYTV